LILPLALILFYIFRNGISALNWAFFTQLPKPVGEAGGGVVNAIAGTLMLVALAAAGSLPLGIFSGIFLAESNGKFAQAVRLCVDILQGIPSIVTGIIAYAVLVLPMRGFSALSGGFALGLMMFPTVTKATEETIRLIPDALKEASFALGAPYYRTMLKIVLPSGLSGIMSGVLLGMARIMGETAPLLFTAFGNPFLNFNVLKPVHSLPLLIFNYAMSPYEDWRRLAWGASLLLVLFVLGLSLTAKRLIRR
jgi:phosphate transport system permease protein